MFTGDEWCMDALLAFVGGEQEHYIPIGLLGEGDDEGVCFFFDGGSAMIERDYWLTSQYRTTTCLNRVVAEDEELKDYTLNWKPPSTLSILLSKDYLISTGSEFGYNYINPFTSDQGAEKAWVQLFPGGNPDQAPLTFSVTGQGSGNSLGLNYESILVLGFHNESELLEPTRSVQFNYAFVSGSVFWSSEGAWTGFSLGVGYSPLRIPGITWSDREED